MKHCQYNKITKTHKIPRYWSFLSPRTYHLQPPRGFALLYSIIIISLILTIAISISDTTYKQGVLSSLARDSQIAFYQADTGIECGMYWDAFRNSFASPMAPGTAPDNLDCGDRLLKLVAPESQANYLVYQLIVTEGSDPCFKVVFDKTALGPSELGHIQSRGYNICDAGPKQVERALEVVY